ncbi:alpha-amylase family protein [Mucilaginibacter sp.]|uniref:alpha-amylase family protein n=1 Tax=Mucilaginibacter sp. TaxID=1882438 RepID=UPI0035BBE4D7
MMIGAIPGKFSAYTEIVISAPKQRIWDNVTRVRAIDERQDKAVFTRSLGFPRPVKAELDKNAVGGKRKAIFDKGLIFDELVTQYEDQKEMSFTIHANPYDIPSTTMDEHIVIGGEFFNVLKGTYQLEQIDTEHYKLKLSSSFQLNTTFNFYAGIWATWIMKDIQQNILMVIKDRAESNTNKTNMSTNNKLIIYQLLPRLFGNTNTTNKIYGSIEENGVGKLKDITDTALQEIAKMGFSHVWYTGVIEHATMTDYSANGITPDDPDVVKGRAGSPYAIKDYYDIATDLADDKEFRISEFKELIGRTHQNGMKMIIDFVPNHVARTYASDVKPDGVSDIGEDDDNTLHFSPDNDFYYMPGYPFVVPGGYNPGGDEFASPLKDGKFHEFPAKATGNDVFNPAPSINDWFETIKLNHGVYYLDGHKCHFDGPPPLWGKMLHILRYWANMGVDGFRCDMIEMVPVEFWAWLIPQLKQIYPGLIFIGEAYDKNQYNIYIQNGGFDYLYDKVGLYDAIRRLTCNEPGASAWQINDVWNNHTRGIDKHMLRFMENHDEQRIASKQFAGDALLAIPGMIVSATLNTGPVMIYSGQEVGEPASGECGFSGDDGRTTIFDYWAMPEFQKWVNGGKYDGGQLSAQQSELRGFYSKLLNTVKNNDALCNGAFYELMIANESQPGFDTSLYFYIRYTALQRVLVAVNFSRQQRTITVKIPGELITEFGLTGAVKFADLLSGQVFNTADVNAGVEIIIGAANGLLLNL